MFLYFCLYVFGQIGRQKDRQADRHADRWIDGSVSIVAIGEEPLCWSRPRAHQFAWGHENVIFQMCME